ncbi:MAG: DUF1501 domain-containing protein [bacterium]|nr:DUF1501 domain-containing protein [bacterium]
MPTDPATPGVASAAPPSRRSFLRGSAAALLAASTARGSMNVERSGPHFPPRARRVIYLFQAGAPSQFELFDDKPVLREFDGRPLPASLTRGVTVNDQLRDRKLLAAGAPFGFRRHGDCGHELSELLPNLGAVADRIAIVRSMQTEQLNHDPALNLMQTGHPAAGRPSLGAWVGHALGSSNRKLPAFAVLVSRGRWFSNPLNARLWGSAFLSGRHQGIELRSGSDPVLFLRDPEGIAREQRAAQLATQRELHALHCARSGDPECSTRMAAQELAYEMQASVPEALDLTRESPATLALYGAKPGQSSFANNCLMARRLAERGVRFIQLYHKGWDHHYQLPKTLTAMSREVDRASAALLVDLERRGLLHDTLVVWGGEFGRTPMNQGGQGGDRYGRDHWGKAFSVWLAGGGVRAGAAIGRTDDFGFDVVERPVPVHDLHATMLHLLGLDHERLTFRHQGRDFRLTDVAGEVVAELIA